MESDVVVVAKYAEMKEILAGLINIGYDIVSVNLDEPEAECYYDEYILTLCRPGIFVQKMKINDNYVYTDADAAFFLDDCCSRVIPKVESPLKFAIEIFDASREDFYE